MSNLNYGVPDEPDARIIADTVRSELISLGHRGPLWFDFRDYGAALTVEVNYRRRWWSICASNTGEIRESVRGVHDYLRKEKESMTPSVTKTLKDRGATHGDFGDNATVALQIRDVMRGSKQHWANCTAEQRLALDEIALKIARILSGGNGQAEHWHDIVGYATLGEQACSKTS